MKPQDRAKFFYVAILCVAWISCGGERSGGDPAERGDGAVRVEEVAGDGGAAGDDDSGLTKDEDDSWHDPRLCDESGLEAEGARLDMEELFAADCTGDLPIAERQFEVLRDEDALRAALMQSAWHRHPSAEDEELPPVDFDEEVVLAAFAGQQGSCGSTFRISRVYEQEEQVEVVVMLGTHCTGDDARTFPYSFAKAPQVDKPYVFTLREKDCCAWERDDSEP